MIAASFQPDPGQLAAALNRQAEAIAAEIATEAAIGQTRDSTEIWRNARLLWPAFTAPDLSQGG